MGRSSRSTPSSPDNCNTQKAKAKFGGLRAQFGELFKRTARRSFPTVLSLQMRTSTTSASLERRVFSCKGPSRHHFSWASCAIEGAPRSVWLHNLMHALYWRRHATISTLGAATQDFSEGHNNNSQQLYVRRNSQSQQFSSKGSLVVTQKDEKLHTASSRHSTTQHAPRPA